MGPRGKTSFWWLGLLLAGCTTMPSGPSQLVLPGTGKGFEQFQGDDALCRQYAVAQSGGATADQAAADSVARSAALGTALGAVAGAAIDGSRGAVAGAGTGALFGGVAGAGAGETSSYRLQQRYDHAYIQCMYAKGHRVPVRGDLREAPQSRYPPPPPPPPRSAR